MKRVVVVGGGTGNFVVLRGLKKYPLELTAIVSMADDGGSTGILRDELGVLPPGDVRQCLVALSNSSRLLRSLMNYRFENGGLGGHSFGNLLLSALEKVTGKEHLRKLEGCLSLPDIWGDVQRFPRITVRYLDETGKQHKRKFRGFMSTVIQHEIDHLNGTLFPKRVLEQGGTLYKSEKDEKGEDVFEELKI